MRYGVDSRRLLGGEDDGILCGYINDRERYSRVAISMIEKDTPTSLRTVLYTHTPRRSDAVSFATLTNVFPISLLIEGRLQSSANMDLLASHRGMIRTSFSEVLYLYVPEHARKVHTYILYSAVVDCCTLYLLIEGRLHRNTSAPLGEVSVQFFNKCMQAALCDCRRNRSLTRIEDLRDQCRSRFAESCSSLILYSLCITIANLSYVAQLTLR